MTMATDALDAPTGLARRLSTLRRGHSPGRLNKRLLSDLIVESRKCIMTQIARKIREACSPRHRSESGTSIGTTLEGRAKHAVAALPVVNSWSSRISTRA
jgi:hypothetical protein